MAGPTDSTRAERKRARPILLAELRRLGSMPCPRCGEPMRIGMDLDVGHAEDVVDGGRGSLLRLEHEDCNRGAGDRRRRRRVRVSRQW